MGRCPFAAALAVLWGLWVAAEAAAQEPLPVY